MDANILELTSQLSNLELFILLFFSLFEEIVSRMWKQTCSCGVSLRFQAAVHDGPLLKCERHPP